MTEDTNNFLHQEFKHLSLSYEDLWLAEYDYHTVNFFLILFIYFLT